MEQIHPTAAITFFDWLGGSPASLGGFRAAVDRFNDPNIGVRILKRIIVRASDFERWLRGAAPGRRGPRLSTTGFEAADRKSFRLISKLRRAGKAQSAYGAALMLARDGKLACEGSPESKAKRVSARYRKEHPESH
jgi:hypothetical protein